MYSSSETYFVITYTYTHGAAVGMRSLLYERVLGFQGFDDRFPQPTYVILDIPCIRQVLILSY